MDTLNLIEKILFVFTDNIWIFYLAVCLRQQVRMKAVSVREMTFLALLDKALELAEGEEKMAEAYGPVLRADREQCAPAAETGGYC